MTECRELYALLRHEVERHDQGQVLVLQLFHYYKRELNLDKDFFLRGSSLDQEMLFLLLLVLFLKLFQVVLFYYLAYF